MYSVLQNKSKMIYSFNTFPYLIIDDALPVDLYNKLKSAFPSNLIETKKAIDIAIPPNVGIFKLDSLISLLFVSFGIKFLKFKDTLFNNNEIKHEKIKTRIIGN